MTRGRRSVRNPSSSLVFYAFHRFPLQSSCTERQRERERNLITAVLTSIYQSANVQSSLLPSPLLWRMALHPIWLVFKTKPPHWHTCACPRCQAEVASHTHGHHINGVCVCVFVCFAGTLRGKKMSLSVSRNGRTPVIAPTSWHAGRLFLVFSLLSLAPTLGLMRPREITGFLRSIVPIRKLGRIFTL